jgi:GDSL-like Lipase/Acylhydrolase family
VPRRLPPILANLLLSVTAMAAVLLALLGLEYALRLAQGDYLTAMSRDDLNYMHGYSERYGWAPRKGARYRLKDEWMTINRLGYRGPEHPPERLPGKSRVVMLGDSIAFGYGVADDKTFSAALERMDPRLEVVNLGVQGYGTDQELIKLEEEGLAYHPDVVILNVCLANDFLDNARSVNFGYPKPYFRYEAGRLVRHDAHVKLAWPARARLFLDEKSALFHRLVGLLPSSRRVESRLVKGARDRELTARLVARVCEVAGDHGARCLVLLHPAERDYGDPSARAERRLLDSELLRGLAVVDLKPLYEDEGRGPAAPEQLVMDSTGHLTVEGHWITARIVRRLLVERGWLPG